MKPLILAAIYCIASPAIAEEFKLPKSPISLAYVTDDGGILICSSRGNGRKITKTLPDGSQGIEVSRGWNHLTLNRKAVNAVRLTADGTEPAKYGNKAEPCVLITKDALTPFVRKLLRPGCLILIEKNDGSTFDGRGSTNSMNPGQPPAPGEVCFAMACKDCVTSYRRNFIQQKRQTKAGVEGLMTYRTSEMRQWNSPTGKCLKVEARGKFKECDIPAEYGPCVFVTETKPGKTQKATLDYLGKLLRPGSVVMVNKLGGD